MAVNIAFAGVIRDEAAQPVQAYYQAYFRHVNGGSSASTWKSTVKQANANGTYSFNLGDGDFLTPSGNASAGDQVLIAIWTGGDSDRLSIDKVLLAYKIFTLTSSETYIEDLVALANNAPVTSFSVPATIRQLTNTTLTNNSNDDSTDTGMEQRATAFSGAVVVFQAVGIDYVFWYINNNIQLPAVVGTNNITLNIAFGTYDLSFRAYDWMGAAGNLQQNVGVNITYRPPVSNSLTPSPPTFTINDVVTFTPSNTDVDNRLTAVDYEILGIGVVETGLGLNEPWQYQFPDNVQYTIRQTIRWHDGYADQTVVRDYTVNVANIGPTASFARSNQVVSTETISMSDTSTDPDGVIASRLWEIRDQGNALVFSGTGVNEEFTPAATGDYTITLTVYDDSGSSDQAVEIVTVVAGGGGVVGGSPIVGSAIVRGAA